MSDLAMDSGKAYLDGMYRAASNALDVVIWGARWDQFEVSRLIGELLAIHDAQDALLWRTAIRKTGANTRALDTMVTPSVEILRNVRSQILALWIDADAQWMIEWALLEVHSGASWQVSELSLDMVE